MAEILPIQIEVSDPQMEILESVADTNLFHAGVGSGKSHLGGIITAEFMANNWEIRGFIGANTYGQLSNSTLDRIFNVWKTDFQLERDRDYVVDRIPPEGFVKIGARLKKYNNTISFRNGHLIVLGSMEEYQNIDGTEFGYAILDETKDTPEEAVKEVIIARLRQKGMWLDERGTIHKHDGDGKFRGYNPLYILTSPAKVDWIAKWFELDKHIDQITNTIFSKETYFRKRIGNKLVVISSTYHNEKNLPSGYIDRILEDLAHDEGRRNMQIFGSPLGKAGNEFYTSFDRHRNVVDMPINYEKGIHCSWDFNYNPYITITIHQMTPIPDDDGIHSGKYWSDQIDEICLSSPHNNTEDSCLELIKKYEMLLKNGFFYYGDYSGKNRGTVSKEFKHNYQVVENMMRKYITPGSNRVTVNEFLAKRRDFINKCLSHNGPIRSRVHPRCLNSILDLEYLRVTPEGTKKKEIVHDKTTGDRYEKYGHTSDASDYFHCGAFESYYD